MNQTIFSLARTFSRVIYPPRCIICQHPGSNNLDLCQPCYEKLPWNVYSCRQCALPFEDISNHDRVCGQCQTNKPDFDFSVSIFRYELPVSLMIRQLKFHQQLKYARLLGQLFCQRLSQLDSRPEAILPVPLHISRLRHRGFNQSVELAKILAKDWQVPLLTQQVIRVRKTSAQTGMDAKQRRRNIRGAFKVVGEIQMKHIAIIDDVVTTGSTVNELSRVLKESGVERVDVYSIARAWF